MTQFIYFLPPDHREVEQAAVHLVDHDHVVVHPPPHHVHHAPVTVVVHLAATVVVDHVARPVAPAEVPTPITSTGT